MESRNTPIYLVNGLNSGVSVVNLYRGIVGVRLILKRTAVGD